MYNEPLEQAFHLGRRVAEHVHGIRTSYRDGSAERVRETLEAIARGDLTLVDTPEESAADMQAPDEIRDQLAAALRVIRNIQRRTADDLLRSLADRS